MQRRSRDVAKALISKGFKEFQGNHRFFIFYTSDDKKSVIQTMISHGSSQSIGPSLLSKMAKQCKLSNPEFLELVDCPMNRTRYEATLIAGGHI